MEGKKNFDVKIPKVNLNFYSSAINASKEGIEQLFKSAVGKPVKTGNDPDAETIGFIESADAKENSMVADLFTEAIQQKLFDIHKPKLGISISGTCSGHKKYKSK